MVFCKSFRIWLWVLLGFSGATQATTLLNGIALHRELGRDQFWGALYTELPSDNAEVLITSPVAKRMELKILAAEGMTLRRFSRMWIEGAAINNASGVLMAQADNMVTFDSFFGGRFETNDHIVLRFVPGEGVDVIARVVGQRSFIIRLSRGSVKNG
jgi:protein TonB